jgi:hypothetical protein
MKRAFDFDKKYRPSYGILRFLFQTKYFMGKLLYMVALLFILVWIIGFFGLHFGVAIHILLIIAIVIIIMRFFGQKNTV